MVCSDTCTARKCDRDGEQEAREIMDTKGCDAKTLAMLAAQFIRAGDSEEDALKKANALYIAASNYAKRFASMSADEKAFEIDPEGTLRAWAESQDLAIGDSESNSPALKRFRDIAET